MTQTISALLEGFAGFFRERGSGLVWGASAGWGPAGQAAKPVHLLSPSGSARSGLAGALEPCGDACTQASGAEGAAAEQAEQEEQGEPPASYAARARAGLTQMRNALHDTPDVAATLAGTIMGKSYGHRCSPNPVLEPPPASLAARVRDACEHHRRRSSSASQAGGWGLRPLGGSADELVGLADGPASSPGPPWSPGWGGRGGWPGLRPQASLGTSAPVAGWLGCSLDSVLGTEVLEDEPGSASAAVAHGLTGSQALAANLRQARQVWRHPHDAAVEAAGRMFGKANYGHA
ncbi:hypothetical protein QJQ45_001612 [Haematococcus lacustris]|nr:hypothetical protein QJQ45_001612 [Haematococcus lacustris]